MKICYLTEVPPKIHWDYPKIKSARQPHMSANLADIRVTGNSTFLGTRNEFMEY